MKLEVAAAVVALSVLASVPAGTSAAAAQEPGEARRVTLDEAVRAAIRNNPELTRSSAVVDQAETRRLSAWGEFLPDVNLGYGFSDASTGRLDPTGQAITTTSWTLQMGASLQLFDGFRRFNRLDAARSEVRAETQRHRRTRYETILAVKRAFYNAVAARELIRVEEDRVQRQEDQLEFVRQQLDLGRANRSDLLRSRVDLNNARLALLNAENDARSATFELARVMGTRRRVAPVEAASLEVGPLPFDRRQIMTRALEQGPAVRSARASAEAAEAQVATARSPFLPSLSFQGGWAWQNTDFPPENRSWSFSLQGSLPLFDGFQRESELYRAEAQVEASRAEERSAVLQLRADVDDAFSQVESARAGVDLARRSVELSREDLRVTRERFRLGLATILDLQSAQITLLEAEVELVQRRFDYQIGIARLESLLGTELDPGSAAGSPGPAPATGSGAGGRR